MSINIGPPAVEELRPRITVIGVGGAGGNAIANMIAAEIEGVDFVVANTDAQALNNAAAEQRIQLGADITQGLGAGARPEVGRAAAEESLSDIERMLEGTHMCFIAAGMGGGTGTGAAPVIAKAARDKGVLTVGVVTKPFLFEGTRRMRAADAGIEELQKHVDTLIVIPNQNLFLVAKAETTFKEAFSLADEVLQQGVRSITDLMVMPGLINLDFADVRSVMGEMGKAMMGTGEGEGENRALEAAEKAIANPLLDGVSMQGAKGVIISIIGGDDMKLLEVDEAANHIRELVDPDANIIWGSAFNPDLRGKIRVSVVATGIEQSAQMAEQAAHRPLNLGAARGPGRPSMTPPAAEPLFGSHDEDEPAPFEAETAAEAPEPEAAPLDSAADDSRFATGAQESGFADDDDDWSPPAAAAQDDEDEPLELALDDEVDGGADEGEAEAADAGVEASGDDLLSNASQLHGDDEPASGSPMPGRRRGLLAGGGDEDDAPRAPRPGAGSTLFERMANLSRGGSSAPDEDEEDEGEGEGESGGPSISIPRFLGRQNNQ